MVSVSRDVPYRKLVTADDNEVDASNPLPTSIVSGGSSSGSLDQDNSTSTPLADGGTFTGEWTSSAGLSALSFVAITSHQYTVAKLEWSSSPTGPAESDTIINSEVPYHESEQFLDGVYVYYPPPDTFLLRGYYRLILENNSGSNQTFATASLFRFPSGTNPWTFTGGTDQINPLEKALLTRPVAAPVPLADWTDENTGTLPTGSSITIDPVLNTEPNVLDSGWIRVTSYAGKNILGVLGDTSLKVYLMNASDAQGANIFGNLVPTIVTTANFPSQLSAIFPDKFFRIVVCNDSGSALTDYRILDTAAPDSTEGVSTSIDSSVFGFFPAQITRSVNVARQPDGTYRNFPASGRAVDVDGNEVITTATLSPAGVYTSGWVDTFGWDEVELTIVTDQVSGSDGIEVEFTTDISAPTANAGTTKRTYGADEVSEGFITFRFSPRSEGFRVRYTNGGFAQGTFMLEAVLRADATAAPRGPLDGSVSQTSDAVMGRNVIVARDSVSGAFSNIKQTDEGLHVYSTGGADVQLESLTTWSSRSRTATITSAEVTSSNPLAGRRTITVKANANNNKDIFVGPNSAVNSTNARLVAGESITLDIDDTAEVWVISDGGTQALSIIEIA